MVNFCPVPMIVQSVGGSQLESVFTFIMAMTALYTACLSFQMMMVLCPQERIKLYVFGTIQLAFKLLTIPAIQFGLSVSYIMVTLWLEEGKFLTCKMEIMTQYPGINIQYINNFTTLDLASNYSTASFATIEALKDFSELKNLYKTFNTLIPSVASVERLFNLGGGIFIKNRLLKNFC